DFAEVGNSGVEDRFPHGAFVEFSVADQRVLSAGSRSAGDGLHVATRHCAPNGRCRTDSHASGRIIDRIGVLGSAWVGLQSTEFTQSRQVWLVELAEQVVDAVQYR